MSSVQSLREFISERLTAAAEEIFRQFEKTIVQYEEEMDRQRTLLDSSWKAERSTITAEIPTFPCKKEFVVTPMPLNQQRVPEEPELIWIKEEQLQLGCSQDWGQVGSKPEGDLSAQIFSGPEAEPKPAQLHFLDSPLIESQGLDLESDKNVGTKEEISTYDESSSSSIFCLSNTSSSKSVNCGSGYYIFGSGTRLFVTDESVVKPVVSVYPAASRVPVERGSSLLCLASEMFPPVVQFSWKRQKNNGPLEDMISDGEQLDLRESGCSASILLAHQQKESSYKYICSVKHEGGTVEVQTQQAAGSTAAPTSHPASSSIPAEGTASVPPLDLVKLSFQSECRVKLLCLLYTVLIVNSLVYCCGLSLLFSDRLFSPSNLIPSCHSSL
ncbi:hypothetical protein OJAV_G00169600 [Oryzias javanicus]|uniref:Ig-like domain-containing protein n=1 Tax=Oryzias javanicus TaxID=123683 RepID=A0A437CEP1_ORYJA|nr:hypothetical protein OJAV_G00169600 [Oryzias javanicus]